MCQALYEALLEQLDNPQKTIGTVWVALCGALTAALVLGRPSAQQVDLMRLDGSFLTRRLQGDMA
jgi:hypothetical protein